MLVLFRKANLKVGDVFSFSGSSEEWTVLSITGDQMKIRSPIRPFIGSIREWAHYEITLIEPPFTSALRAACLYGEVSAAQLKVLIEEISRG